MKIRITTSRLIFPITLSFPTAALKSEKVWDIIIRHTDDSSVEGIGDYKNMVIQCFSELESYVMENGHFNILEYEGHDGAQVLISI